VIASLALYAWAGTVSLRRPVSDFYVAGRLVPALLNGMAIAVCVLPVLAFAGFAGALNQGWDGASLLVLGGGGGIVLIAFLLAPYLRKFGGYTVADFLGERFNVPGVRPLAVLAVILCSFPALALSLTGLAALATRAFEVDQVTALWIAAALVLSCSVVAGMRSASLTQIMQYAVSLAVSALALAILVGQRGTLLPLFSAADLDAALASFKPQPFTATDPLNRFALLFCLVAGLASLPHLLLKSLVTPSVEQARTSFLWALPFVAALSIVAAPYLSLFGPPAVESGFPIPALIATGAIAACLAVGSALAIAIGNTLSYDLYYKGLHRTASTGKRILAARAALLAVVALAAWFAQAAPEYVLKFVTPAFSLAASAFLPALLLGIWWKRASGEGALAGMIAGLVVCLYYMLAPHYIPFAFYESSSFLSNATTKAASHYETLRQSYYLADEAGRAAALAEWEEAARPLANWFGVSGDFAGLFAVPVGFLAMIGVSLFTPAPSREVQSFVEDLRKPQAA
jgi:cation/acetate symporter